MCACVCYFAAGVRQEQDLYIRLIDSVTKQVYARRTHPLIVLAGQGERTGITGMVLRSFDLLTSTADNFVRETGHVADLTAGVQMTI